MKYLHERSRKRCVLDWKQYIQMKIINNVTTNKQHLLNVDTKKNIIK